MIFVLVAFEGPLTTLVASAAASAGLLHLPLVFLFVSFGNLTSDSLWYALGRAGKIDWLTRLGRRPRITPEMVAWLQKGMNRHVIKIMFVAKLTMSFMIPTLITAGLSKIPWRRWFPAVFAGEMVWTGSLVLIGYYFTEAIKNVEQDIQYLAIGLSILFIVFVLWMSRRLLQKVFKNFSRDNESSE